MDAVWGPASARQRAKQLAAAGGGGAGAGGALEGCGGCAELGGADGTVLVIIVAICVAVLAVWLIIKLARYIQERRNALQPRGGDRSPAPLGPRTGVEGVVEADHTLEAPILGERCVAFGLELTARRGFRTHVMLRDGATCGFRIRLDTGKVVHVPRGRAVLDLSDADACSGNSAAVHAYLRSIDPGYADDEPFAPFPHKSARVDLIRPGDRVELLTRLESVLDPSTPATGGYRDNPPTRMVPRDVPRLRRVDG